MRIHLQTLQQYHSFQASAPDSDPFIITRARMKKEELRPILFLEGYLKKKDFFQPHELYVLFWEDKTVIFQGQVHSHSQWSVSEEKREKGIASLASLASPASPVSPKKRKSKEEAVLTRVGFVAQKPESLSLSSLKYEDEMDLTAFIFADSVKMHDVFAPHFVSATLQAEWLQQSEGLLDIGPAVAAHFPQGIVSSLNDDFGDVSHHVKKSGYQIVETSFQGINPPHTGPLNIYPQNATIVGKNNPMTLPRHWFRLSWKMGWTYEQKRIETVTLSWPFCPFGYPVPPLFEFSKDAPQGLRVCVPSEETLIDSETSMLLWKVQDVEKTKGFRPHLATLKELWPQLIKKALPSLKQAFVERFQTPAWVTVSWEKGCLLSPGQKISWQHQQQLFHGIISKIEIHAENSKREALLHVRLTPPWLQAWQNSQETLSAVFALTSLQGFTQETLTEAESLVDVSIENDAESQTKQLSSCKFSTENEVRNWISQHPTRLRLDLKDLRTKKALHHHYAVLVDNAKQ